MRKEVIGDCTLYLGDCREVLPLLEPVDAVVTDPPYGVGFKYESHIDDPETYPALMRDVIAHVERLRGDGPAVFWQGMKNADRWHEWFPKGFRMFAACKGFTQFRPTNPQFGWDPVIFWGKSKTTPAVGARDWHVQMLAPFGYGRPQWGHPCPRPAEQVQYVLETFTCSGDTVLDPFMGSGTTGVACVRLGRRFIGIEMEAKYFDIACRRLEQSRQQPDMFLEARAKAEQFDLLG